MACLCLDSQEVAAIAAPTEIIIVHERPIKVYYASVEDAESDGYRYFDDAAHAEVAEEAEAAVERERVAAEEAAAAVEALADDASDEERAVADEAMDAADRAAQEATEALEAASASATIDPTGEVNASNGLRGDAKSLWREVRDNPHITSHLTPDPSPLTPHP